MNNFEGFTGTKKSNFQEFDFERANENLTARPTRPRLKIEGGPKAHFPLTLLASIASVYTLANFHKSFINTI